MTLIALLLALVIEKLATRLMHLREVRWLEPYARRAFALAATRPRPLAILLCALATLLPAIPVIVIALLLQSGGPGPAWLAFASLVLVFSLGPRDLGEEVRDYMAREDAGDTDGAARAAAAIIEHDAAQRREMRAAAVEDAIFVQANNRVFGVLFWFVVLGPAGLGPAAAFLFRISDLMRREAIAQSGRDDASGGECAERLHFVLAWLPARLLAVGYALAGSFEDARRGWRERYGTLPARLLERNDQLLVHVGRAAVGGFGPSPAGPAGVALRLVRHALLFWLAIIALLSLWALIA